MIGKCFGTLCVISVIYGIFSGNLRGVNEGILSGASKSVATVTALLGVMTFWQGVMAVFEKSGVINMLSRFLAPVLRFVFPRAFKENRGKDEITAAVSANVLGISNASTPLALNAMEKLNKNHTSSKASDDMIMLCALGASCFCLIPTTVIAIRTGLGARFTYEIILPVWVTSGVCMLASIFLCKVFSKIFKND